MSAGFDAIVIGGGGNGLVAAARLGRAGRRVLLVDAADALGGPGRSAEVFPGFRAAPLGLDPGWVPPKIAASLSLSGLDPVAVDTPLSVVDGAGTALTLSRDPAAAAAAIRGRSARDAAAWGAFTEELASLSGFLGEIYQAAAPDVDVSGLKDALPLLGLGRKYRALGPRGMIEFLRALPVSVWEMLDDRFECAPLKAAVATSGVVDLRQGPRSGGTGLVLLHGLVGAPRGSMRGRVPWRGGPDAFTKAAEGAAKSAGVAIKLGARVERILVRADAVSGVLLSGGEEIPAKSVLSTADPASTMLGLVDPVWLDPEYVRALGNVRYRGCTAYVLYALDALPEIPGLPPAALAGTVSLTADLASLERAADAAKYGTVAARPHVEISVPSILWPDTVPAGKHLLVARVHYAPYSLRDGTAWDVARRDALLGAATAAIEAAAPGFGARVLRRSAFTPLDLEETFGLREGAATQGEVALDQILFMRPVAGQGRHATPIDGLFLGGAGTHPGPGIVGGAGWLAAERLLGARGAGR